MPDEGEGEKKIWRIEDMELVEVPDDQKNYLYDGDCYVILYSGDKTKIVYFWQGSKCSIDERGASAIHAARIDNENLGGLAIQVLSFHYESSSVPAAQFILSSIFLCLLQLSSPEVHV